jgi:heavy metal sensor kinase
MGGVRSWFYRHRLASWPKLDGRSLETRLTLGVTAVSLSGVGAVTVLTGWYLQQSLITTHKQNIVAVAERFPQDVALYSEMLPLQVGLERTLVKLGNNEKAILVQSPTGKLLAASRLLRDRPSLLQHLQSYAEHPLQPKIHRLENRYWILCSGPLVLQGRRVGSLLVAQDITSDQQMLAAMLHKLGWIAIGAILATGILMSTLIRRALKPLYRINQLAGEVSAQTLNSASLQLQHAPTEVASLAASFNQMLNRLATAWEQQREFVSNVSHELRTPLTIVHGYLQSLLRRGQNLTESQQEALMTAASETERTIRLLTDLLDLARVESGHLRLHLESLDARSCCQTVAVLAEQYSGRAITLDLPLETLKIWGDRDRLKQVLLNLLDNAAKYSPGDRPIYLKLAAKGADWVTIQIKDEGYGIPLSQQARIFDRFYRVDDNRCRRTGGTGLGLAIVKALVEGMGGQLDVSSHADVGSTFTLSFSRV